MEKKPLPLVLVYLEPISLQVRKKIRKAMKNTLNCCKLQIIFKGESEFPNKFRFNDRILNDLVSGVVHEYTCGNIKENLLIKRNQPVLNKNNSATVHLFCAV